MIPSTAAGPTFLMSPSPKRMPSDPSSPRSTAKVDVLELMSGGRTSIPRRAHSATACAIRSYGSGELPASCSTAVRYSTAWFVFR